MTPQEFDRACATHDWTYNYSDDHGMWKLGEQQAQVLQWAMQEDNRLIQLYRLCLHTSSAVQLGTSP